jgi:hypothetical protein
LDNTPNLSLPYILAAQAQKHVTHNEALRALDALVQASILDRDLATPPGAPGDGARYIVAAAPTGAWAGQGGKIAAWQDGAWVFYTPKEGWVCWIADEDALVAHNGTSFVSVGGGGGGSVNPTPLVGVNATADSTNRLSVSSPATLFNHEGAGHQVKVNKAAAADTASYLFQTGFSGRAEIGTVGNDDFQFKVSADGSAWVTSIVIASVSGNVGIGTTSPDRRLHAELRDAVTNAVSNIGRLTHTTSGTPANGIGVGLEFEVETSTGNNEVGASIEAIASDTTATSEDFDLVFNTMAGGAAATKRMRLPSTGGLALPDTDASHDLVIKPGANLTAERTFTVTTGDADRTIDLSAANVTFSTLGASLVAASNAAAARTTLGFTGAIVDRAYAEYTANADLTAAIPYDDTIPQNTEGTELLTATITPKATSNRVRIRFSGFAESNGNVNVTVALFKDDGADAIQARGQVMWGGSPEQVLLEYEHVPGTTSAVTYKIRVGPNASGIRFNGRPTTRIYGGVAAATLVLEEIAI